MSYLVDFNPIALLERMLRISSLSGEEHELAHYLAAEMGRLGLKAYVDEAGNAVGEIGSGPTIVLLGHIDTVPGNIPVRIEADSNSENGLLYGRGAVDAKGPFATFVAAAGRIAQRHSQEPLPYHLVLVGAVEEEAASSKGAHAIIDRYKPIACVIGEPSSWDRLTLGYKGRVLIEGRWEQAMAHSAGQGIAVTERAVNFWNGVNAYCQAHNQNQKLLFDQLLPSLREINSGSDGITDWTDLTIGVRLPPAVDPDQLQLAVLDLLEQDSHGGQVSIGFRGGCKAYSGDKNNLLVRAFLKGVRAAGGKPGFLLKTGTSDMNVVGPAWQCPILAYGPGDSNLDHTPNEHINLDEYLRAIDVLESALIDLINSAPNA